MPDGGTVILAYKYLRPKYDLSLSVTKHADVSVLVAVIEKALFTCTVTEDGKQMHKLLAKVRNTQQQYVRVALKPECEIWSTVVAGRPVKPARDEATGEVMIPLEKGANRADQKAHKIELVWMQPPAKDFVSGRG